LDEAKLGELKDTDLSQFRTKLSELERNNAKIRENAAKAEARKTFKELQASSEAMTKQIDAFEREKRKKLDNAAYPVPGLGLDEDRNVTWEGLPFEQASTSQQLRVSVAIGLALNKKLPILLIRQGSDLDPESLAQVAKMAADAKAQVWLETSRTDAPASVIMEDGRATIPEIETQTMPGEA
jgi:ABC-type polar amino acid transport system ATPase subunit